MIKFKIPTKSNLRSRTSTIDNAFVISITPWENPKNIEVQWMLNKLELDDQQCAYCLTKATSVDHFFPLVSNKLPTGYITEISNLVPCCSSCNSSKGGKYWRDWYLSTDTLDRLISLGFSGEKITQRLKVLESYENSKRIKLDYEKILGKEKWHEYLDRKQKLYDLLKEDQAFCDDLLSEINSYLVRNGENNER